MLQVQKNSSAPSLDQSFKKVVDRILIEGKITPSDRSFFESAILSQKCLSRIQRFQISRVCEGLSEGYISVLE